MLILTASSEEDAVMEAVAAGATGYLQKYSGKEQLLRTVRDVANGEYRIPAEAIRRVSRESALPRSRPAPRAGQIDRTGTGDTHAVHPRVVVR